MNTPTHIILNYALLSDQTVSKKEKWSIILGGIIPDIVIYYMFFWALVVGIPQRTLWGEVYFEPGWQLAIDILNSFPLFIGLGLIGWIIKRRWMIFFSLSMCLHFVADFFTHADDAHRHFLPFSNYRFESPVSYWDRNYLGEIGGAIETALLYVAILFLWTRLKTKWMKSLLIVYVIFSLLMSILAPIIFG